MGTCTTPPSVLDPTRRPRRRRWREKEAKLFIESKEGKRACLWVSPCFLALLPAHLPACRLPSAERARGMPNYTLHLASVIWLPFCLQALAWSAEDGRLLDHASTFPCPQHTQTGTMRQSSDGKQKVLLQEASYLGAAVVNESGVFFCLVVLPFGLCSFSLHGSTRPLFLSHCVSKPFPFLCRGTSPCCLLLRMVLKYYQVRSSLTFFALRPRPKCMSCSHSLTLSILSVLFLYYLLYYPLFFSLACFLYDRTIHTEGSNRVRGAIRAFLLLVLADRAAKSYQIKQYL